MAISEITRDGILQALRECGHLNREAFLKQYGFGPALCLIPWDDRIRHFVTLQKSRLNDRFQMKADKAFSVRKRK